MSTGELEQPRRLVILGGSLKTPPLSHEARRRVGFLLRALQEGETLGMPISRPMPAIGANAHELRISDEGGEWRVFYQVRPGIVYVADVCRKTTRATPKRVIDRCRKRLELAE